MLFGSSAQAVARREVDHDDLALVALRQVLAPPAAFAAPNW
jgi:hypothetical protein